MIEDSAFRVGRAIAPGIISRIGEGRSEHDMRSLAVDSSNLSPPTAHRARVGLTERAAGP